MLNQPKDPQARNDKGPQLLKALECVEKVLVDGLRHGHFRCSITSAVGKGSRRDLVIEAGKSHKFTIPEEEMPRT